MLTPTLVFGGWYGGIGIGTIQLEGRCNAAFAVLGVTGCQHNEAAGAWRGYIGYRFNRYFAVEGGYADLGRSDQSHQAVVDDPEAVFKPGTPVEILSRFFTTGFTLNLVGRWPLNLHWTAFFKAGYFDWDAEYRVLIQTPNRSVRVSRHEDGPDTTGGIGFERKLGKNGFLRSGWDYYATDGDHHDFYYLDIGYQFSPHDDY